MRSLRQRSGSLLLLVSLAGTAGASACLYGFAGGGLPPHIKTVAILPFDNDTPEPILTREIAEAVREALEGRLGLRVAPEASADAVVRGRIVRYDPDSPLSYQAQQGRAPDVTQRQVQLVVDVEIVDQKAGRPLWQRSGLTVTGEYRPPDERSGRDVALKKLVNDIVEGAQSQW